MSTGEDAATNSGRGPSRAVAATVALAALGIVGLSYAVVIGDPAAGVWAGWIVFGVTSAVASAVFAIMTGLHRGPPDRSDIGWLDALPEPAAVVMAGGRIVGVNAVWRGRGWATQRLPNPDAAALYRAFGQAGAEGEGRASVGMDLAGGPPVELRITPIGPDRHLVRAQPSGPAAAPAAQVREGEGRAMAAGAPFGSALIAGDDLFAGAAEQGNAAMSVLAGPASSGPAAFGHLFEPTGVAEARARLEAGSSGPIDLVARAHPDRTLHLYVAPEGEARRVWLFDVTTQKSMETQLTQAQKMQAVGQLAGGVAHDFNNLLTAIQLQLSGLLERHPVGDPSYEGLNEIRQTGIRAADLVRKLLAFSRKSTVRRERLDLGDLVGEFVLLLRRLLREDVRLETDYGRDLPIVLADKSQLETAVMNLAVNARDAMRGVVEPGAGVVTISTRRLSGVEARSLGWAEAPLEAEAAMIEVADTGPGVPPDLLDKIFEPFFTTKAVNEGTGMGLATVYGIARQAGGHVAVANLPGSGAAFRLFLPAAGEVELAEVPAIEPKAAKAPRDLSGAGRILFVEDEAAVRTIAAKLLRQRGYEVIEAADGEEALELAEAHAGEIDMMISDVIMPGLDGPSLLKKARPYLGDAPVMFISGYAESDFSDLLADETGVSFLPKPLDIKTLAERVKQQLRPV